MMKVYKAVHERENKCKELHKEMNMNVGPTRLVQPDFYEPVPCQPCVGYAG